MKYINFKILFFAILAFYCVFLSQFGMETWDTGYIPSFSWRVINGQDIYADFIYKGPPITIYFHAFWMKILPVEGQFYFIRIVNYLLFSLQVYFTLSGFDVIYDFKKNGFDKWILMCVCFVISFHNFPPYPWPTTDGILFASIAFWILAKNKLNKCIPLFLVALFSLLSALTKQSFYLIPIGFLFWIFVQSGLKKSIFYVFSLILIFGCYLFWISSFTTLDNYFEQTSNQTNFTDLYNSGFSGYINSFKSKWILVFVMLLPIIPIFIFRKKEINLIKQYLRWLIISFFCAGIINHVFNDLRFASLQLFIVCGLSLIYHFFFIEKNIKFIAPFLISLLIAWSTAISLGYPFTVLSSTGMICVFILLFYKEIPRFKNSNIVYSVFVSILCLVSFSSNKYPYHENYFTELTYNLEAISPKLKYIKTTKATFEKHLELKQLIQKYGTNFIVAPNTPMANYIFDTQSQLPADWIITNEVMGRESIFIRLCANKKNYIFVEKEFIYDKVYTDYYVLHSEIASFVFNKFNKIDQTKHYFVFNALKPNEKLP